MLTNFTFGVVTYNSDSTIIETMESIKYQIVKYGQGIRFNLVLSDDCSKDNTILYVNKWIEKNRTLFYEVKILSTPQNSGLCVNYSLMVSNIHTKHFIQIAGDDIICSKNILIDINNVGENELRVHLPLIFDGEKVEITEDNIARQLFYKEYKHCNKKDIRLLETLTPYASTQILFLRHHYSVESMEFIKQYRNFEDDTSLYYILKNNEEAVFSFCMDPLVIYRKSGTSLTTSVDNTNQIRFLDDLYKFRKLTLKEEKHLFTKLFLVLIVWDVFLMKHRFNASNSLDRKLKKWINDKRIRNGKNNICFSKQCDTIHSFLTYEEEYLKYLKEKSESFYSDECP